MPRVPWGRSIDHHKSIDYAATQERLIVPFTVRREADGKLIKFVVSGNCPACGGLMTKEIPFGIGGSGTKGWRGPGRPADVPASTWVYCECGHEHPSKPASATDEGCGRYWLIGLKTT